MDITVNNVKITLTKEQLQEIDKELKKNRTVDSINSYEDACEVLGITDLGTEFRTVEQKLRTIIKAANYLDNSNTVWKADFSKTTDKFIPYFEYKAGSGWLVDGVSDCFYRFSCAPVWFYFMKRETANKIANKFLSYYNEYIG